MSKAANRRRNALGKGLSVLLPGKVPAKPPQQTQPGSRAIAEIPVDDIQQNPLQPRTIFQPERLAELAQSIRANGIIQPLIVRNVNGVYELVAGERRWRAARMAGLATVPVVVRELADNRLLEMALIENIQREDLNPIEVAQAFERMGRELDLSHDEIGKRTGKDRSTVTNMLRLLRLPQPVQLLLAEQSLSMGHARAIVSLPTSDLQLEVAQKAAAQQMSVRQVERLVQKLNAPQETKTEEPKTIDPNVKAAVEELEHALGTRVRIIERANGRGRVEIEYYSQDDLHRVYQIITGES